MTDVVNQALLRVEGLKVSFKTLRGDFRVLNGVSLYVDKGESISIVGETGCGKSLTLKAILGLVQSPPAVIEARELIFQGENLLDMSSSERRRLRGRYMAYIPQEPSTSLNPVFTVAEQFMDLICFQGDDVRNPVALISARFGSQWKEARKVASEALKSVQIADVERVLRAYPAQLSGGMAQRVLIAMALVGGAKLLFADEPGTALDVTTQLAIHDLLREQVLNRGLALVYVTHNLGVARQLTNRTYVMYAGDVVEAGPTDRLLEEPAHPYTQGLLRSVPRLAKTKYEGIDGVIPDYREPPEGCRFHPRCQYAKAICSAEKPATVRISPDRNVNCVLY